MKQTQYGSKETAKKKGKIKRLYCDKNNLNVKLSSRLETA